MQTRVETLSQGIGGGGIGLGIVHRRLSLLRVVEENWRIRSHSLEDIVQIAPRISAIVKPKALYGTNMNRHFSTG